MRQIVHPRRSRPFFTFVRMHALFFASLSRQTSLNIPIMSRLLTFLARPILFFYALPWLMLLLVLGTVAQRYDGLYVAERTYFSSIILWLGPVPLPGGLTILGLITTNLLAKMLQQRIWRGKKLGTTITHCSVLVLMLGGCLTTAGREEGFMELAPHDQSAAVTDYNQRVFLIKKNATTIQEIPFEELHSGMTINGLPFNLTINAVCRHCAPEAAPIKTAPEAANTNNAPKESTIPAEEHRGTAQQIKLVAAPLLLQDENNLSGATVTISGLDDKQNGTYVVFTPLHQKTEVTQGTDHYQLIIQRKERPLPFSLRLEQFYKSEHPGTRIARAYRSDVIVTDGATSWPVTIEMNTPRRYRGYTVYQASYIERPDATATVLTIVRDKGQIFPYIAITALCLGMLIHLVGLLRQRKTKARP
jgi:hypothetical protein